MMAAETEIFKLSVKPCIGILRKTSAISFVLSDMPSFSAPKKKTDFLVTSKSESSQPSVCGVVATIWYPWFFIAL